MNYAFKRYANKLRTNKDFFSKNNKFSAESDELIYIETNNPLEDFIKQKEQDGENEKKYFEVTDGKKLNNELKIFDENENFQFKFQDSNDIKEEPPNDQKNIETNDNPPTFEINEKRRSSRKSESKNYDLDLIKKKLLENQTAERHFVISDGIINLNEKDEDGRNVLHRAALQQKLEIIKSITINITNPMIIDQKDIYGNTALLLACKNFNFQKDNATRIEILNILIKRGADVNTFEPVNHWTPLHWLAFNGDENSLSLLIKKGAVYFMPDIDGYFPIDLAGMKNYSKIVESIIQEFLKFLDLVGNFKILDPSILANKSSKLSQTNLEFVLNKSVDNEFHLNFNSNENFLERLNTRFQVENKTSNGGLKNLLADYPDPNTLNSSNSKLYDDKSDDDDEDAIKTNLHLMNPILQTVLIKVFAHHCLYWASYYKINTMYVNKLITLYNAKPSFKIFSARLQSSIHGACMNGNMMAFKLLLNKFNEDKLGNKIVNVNVENLNKRIAKTENFLTSLKNEGIKIMQKSELKNYKNLMKKDYLFNSFSDKFRKYLIIILKKVFPSELKLPLKKFSKLPKERDILQLKDKNINNPLHLAASNGKNNFIDNLLESDLLEKPLDQFFNQINREGFSGYALLKEEKLKNRILQKCGKIIYNVPLVVLELLNNTNSKNAINLIIKLAIAEKLKAVLMEHQDKSKVYICLDISDDVFKIQAEKEKLKVKLLEQNLKKNFENNEDFIISAEPFFSRMKQEIIFKMISNVLDLKLLKDQNILIGLFYTHKPNVTDRIKKIWLDHPWFFPNPFRIFIKMISQGKEIFYNEINLLYRYFGEKIALYYAFVSFYINYLTFIAFVGLIVALYYRERIYLSNSMFPTYSIIFLIWEIIFIEGWKRKNAEITHKWGVNEIYNKRELRPGFRGDEYFKELNGKLEKHQKSTKKIILFLLSLPIIIGLLMAVIFIFYYATLLEKKYENTPLIKYVPGIAKSLSIIIINKVYDKVATLFTELENHKYEDIYENAIIAKIFSFRLVNDLTAVIYTTITTQNVENLKSLLYSLIFIKLITEPIFNIVIPYFKLKWLRRNYFNKVKSMSKEYEESFFVDPKQIEIRRMRTNNTTLRDNGIVRGNIKESNSNLNNNENKINSRKREFADNLKEKFLKKYQTISNFLTKKIEKSTRSPKSNLPSIYDPNQFNINFYRKIKIVNGDDEMQYSAHNINPDFIELNNQMQIRGDIILHYADICIVLTVSSLFSIVIPLAPLIVIIFTTVSLNLKIYADLHLFKRPPAEKAMNIGLWLNIIDIISTVSIIFNAFLYYYYNNNQFNVYTKYISKSILVETKLEINVGEGETALLFIALAEHVIILLKYFLRYLIPDVPVWVTKERDLLLSILEESNREKEELHNQAVDNVINQHMKMFNTTIDGKNKEIQKFKDNLTKNMDTLKNYKDELEKANSKINQVEYINKIMSDKNEKLENLRKEYLKYLNESKIRKSSPIKNENEFNKGITLPISSMPTLSDIKKNSEKYVPQRKMGKKDFEQTIDFKFDQILEKITKDILRGRQIVLQEEITEMRKNINKLYIFNLLKNTFDRIEKEIIVKKFRKCIQLIEKPIVVCNLCNTYQVKFYCFDCEEKMCQNCEEIHLSNVLWEKHKCQLIVVEKDIINISSVNDKKSDLQRLLMNPDDMNYNITSKREEESLLYRSVFRRQTIRGGKEKTIGMAQRKSLMNKLRKKGIIQNKKLYNNYALGNTNYSQTNLDSTNQIFTNSKDKHNSVQNSKINLPSSKKNISNLNPNSFNNLNIKTNVHPHSDSNNQPHKNFDPSNFGLFQKMESFCFPVKAFNLNFENLKVYFDNLKREYIDKNGINSDNTVDTKKFIESKIDSSAKFLENPNSVLQEDFTQIINSTSFNFEEQFFINRISFHKFKEYGAQLEVNHILEMLKTLQESTYEEKLKLILNLIDIHGNKLIIKSELEKLLVCLALQNEEKNYRINYVIDELYGKKNVIEYDKLYHSCLEDVINRELFCEILQINE